MSVKDTITRLRAAAAAAVPTALADAVDAFEMATRILTLASEGSTSSQAGAAAAGFDQAAAATGEAHRACVMAKDAIDQLIARLLGDISPSVDHVPQQGKRLTADEVAKMSAPLPPPVPKPDPNNKKTHGRWIDGRGNTHVEVKVAVRMIQQKQRHSNIAINNLPHIGPLGYDSLLPILLPEDYSVTVYGPDGYSQTFTGGKTW
jgi:Double-stranded DNA deaminase toxin A